MANLCFGEFMFQGTKHIKGRSARKVEELRVGGRKTHDTIREAQCGFYSACRE